MRNPFLAFSCVLLILTVCSTNNVDEKALRDAVTKYITAIQNGNINQIYHLELPESQKENSLENYEAHDLIGLSDSSSHFSFQVRSIEHQNDTARILVELQFKDVENTRSELLTAIQVNKKWFIPTYSSDVNNAPD